MCSPAHLDAVQRAIVDVVEPAAIEVDRAGEFPVQAVAALRREGLLGLVSAREVGGGGADLGAAVDVVRHLARHCASTAMITCMHYAATAVLEAYGSESLRREIASGEHLTTLAFSEAGSRSHFWAPVGTASPGPVIEEGGAGEWSDVVRLEATKSWVTAASAADSYVWSSRPLNAPGTSSLWLVPADAVGLKVIGAFDGLGLRGNDSSPVVAEGVTIPADHLLGGDGAGFEVMMDLVLPWFCLMNAGFSVGVMQAATTATADHAAGVRLEHVGDRLADLPTIRSYVARMRIATDQAATLVADAVDAVTTGREDAQLRVLEAKAAAAEAATEVTGTAMRVCGGAAFRKDLGIERRFRDARAATVMAPTTDVLYDFIGKAVCGLPLFATEE